MDWKRRRFWSQQNSTISRLTVGRLLRIQPYIFKAPDLRAWSVVDLMANNYKAVMLVVRTCGIFHYIHAANLNAILRKWSQFSLQPLYVRKHCTRIVIYMAGQQPELQLENSSIKCRQKWMQLQSPALRTQVGPIKKGTNSKQWSVKKE